MPGFNCTGVTDERLAPSVVAIHGLGGDSIQTWTHRQTGVYWPRDLFPQDVADARVMVFDYNAAMAFGKSTADIADHAKDLLSSLYDQRETEDGAVVSHSLSG